MMDCRAQLLNCAQLTPVVIKYDDGFILHGKLFILDDGTVKLWDDTAYYGASMFIIYDAEGHEARLPHARIIEIKRGKNPI